MKEIIIGNKKIGEGHPCLIIAEMSANHSQDFNKAIRLIQLAKESGADAVKLQTYTPDTITMDCDNEYFKIKEGPWKGQTLYDLYKKAYTPWDWQIKLMNYASSLDIILFSSPFDSTAVDLLEQIKVPAYKIASFELVDIPLIRYIASKRKPIILSTGMSTYEEIELAIQTIKNTGNDDIILLKCTSAYPAPAEQMNLLGIRALRNKFSQTVGLSDHSTDTRIPLIAVGLGAKVIEKHLIEKRSDGGPDAHFSIEPHELRELVGNIRFAEKALGNVEFKTMQCETDNIIFRRSLFATENIKKGECFTKYNVRSIRPGFGLSPKLYEIIVGKKALHDISRGTPLTTDSIDMST